MPGRTTETGEIRAHYEIGLEDGRLGAPIGELERLRTEELIERHLGPRTGRALDVGGGTGPYAQWLAERGWQVELVDLVELHVSQARQRFRRAGLESRARARQGDARSLDERDDSCEALLLLGPLYHLTEAAERAATLAEARRVLGPGGWLFAAGISRWASLLGGLSLRLLRDPVFSPMVDRDLGSGQHRNPSGKPEYFTTAYFHRPEELAAEVAAAGFDEVVLYGVEGPGWILPDLDERWAADEGRAELLRTARELETVPEVLGASAHLLVAAR